MTTAQRRIFLRAELLAVNYGSLTGVVTEEEWRERASLLMRMEARV